MKKILVAIDGSDCSINALLLAREIGSLSGADITILLVVCDFKNYPYAIDKDYTERLRDDIVSQSTKVVEDAKGLLKDYPGKVDARVVQGSVEKEILDLSESGGFDLIALGSRGLGKIKRTMLGSTSYKILNDSNIPVLIAKGKSC